jgi:hypothetical protein
MRIRRILILPSFLALAALACSLGGLGLSQDITLTATAQVSALQTQVASQLTQIAHTATPPSSPTGSISGTLNYPADALPAMRVAAFDTLTSQPYYVDTAQNQPSYEITGLPAGTYYIVFYSLGGGSFPFGLAGGYTAAVACGLTEACTDHSLLPVTVAAGQETSGIRPADWVGDNTGFPPFPGPVPSVPTPAGAGQGTITGHLSYPSELIPPLVVVAFTVNGGPGNYFYILTQQDQASYSLPLPAGDYYVVAYVVSSNYAGGYTPAVACGPSADCSDHSLIPVRVDAGATVSDIDPSDWYAPEGTFPPNPIP